MIHTVYVIHQLSGVCILYKKYGTIEFNEDLIAGFLMALKDFSHEVTGGKGNIKILDMVTYHIHLVFKKGILIAAASDKKDSKEIAQNKLGGLLDEFVVLYGESFENWSGDIRIFKDFDNIIDKKLEMGKIAEVPRIMPLLKIYKKYYKKETKKLKKGTTLDEKIIDSIEDEKNILSWKEKRLPKMVISQGALTDEEYNLAHCCDGFKDINEIAEEAGIMAEKAQIIVDKLNRLGMLTLLKI
ncbi:MAG: hypothetical protein ACTSWY_00855 [Promethearchaeota archaeon]